MEKLIRFIVAVGSIVVLFFLAKNITYIFDIGIETFGIYIMIAAVTITFYGILPTHITDVFNNSDFII